MPPLGILELDVVLGNDLECFAAIGMAASFQK